MRLVRIWRGALGDLHVEHDDLVRHCRDLVAETASYLAILLECKHDLATSFALLIVHDLVDWVVDLDVNVEEAALGHLVDDVDLVARLARLVEAVLATRQNRGEKGVAAIQHH